MRTERRVPGESTRIIHTVYEPGSFTPLVRLQKAANPNEEESAQAVALLQAFTHTPMQERMRAYLQDPGAIAALIENNAFVQEKLGAGAAGFIKAQLQELQQQRQEQDDKDAQGVELSFYLCDHLGTPNALVDQSGSVIWAARMDAWGDIQQEYDPNGIGQVIRLPGQHQDRETGLYYNRYRYYDRNIGGYINQDLIGFEGGINKNIYPLDPTNSIDPWGLFKVHGNWCGPDWTGGHEYPYADKPDGYYHPPTTYTDAACERHDKCFATCRELNPCNKGARSSCMKECNRDLARAQRFGSTSGTSFATSISIYLAMKLLPDAGDNSLECHCG